MRSLNGLVTHTSILVLAVALLASCSSSDDDPAGGVDANVAQSIDASNLPIADARPPSPDAIPSPDATPVSLACAGEALPTTVLNPPITISGSVQSVANISGPEPLGVSASIKAFRIADDGLIVAVNSVATTGSNTFSLSDPVGGSTPLAAYIKATAVGHVDTYLYPPYDIYENFTNAVFLMFGVDLWGLVPLVAGVTVDEGNGAIMIIVGDCNQEATENATVSIQPEVGQIRYGDSDGLPSSTLTSTQEQGIAFIFNVPPGNYTVDAQRGGVSFREHGVTAFADAATTTIIVP